MNTPHHQPANMNTLPPTNGSAPIRGVLLRNDSGTRFLPSVSASNHDAPVLDASAMASRSHQQFYGSITHPDSVLLSRPEASDADQSLYFQVELSPNSSGHVAFVFDTSEEEVTDQPELDWLALVLESVPKLSATDQQELFAMRQQQAPNSLTSQLMHACRVIEKPHNTTTPSEATDDAGLVFVAADDARLNRVVTEKQYNKVIGRHPDSLILGATLEEAKTAPARVMALANKHGLLAATQPDVQPYENIAKRPRRAGVVFTKDPAPCREATLPAQINPFQFRAEEVAKPVRSWRGAIVPSRPQTSPSDDLADWLPSNFDDNSSSELGAWFSPDFVMATSAPDEIAECDRPPCGLAFSRL